MQARRETVDEADVARFGRLGDEWWSLRGSMRMLHGLNPHRTAWLVEILGKRHPPAAGAAPLDGLSILDIGCGGGLFCEPLARLGARVVGIDPSPENVEVARRHADAAGLKIDYRATTAEDLAETGETFDAVCAMEVIEHVTDVEAFLRAAGRLAKPDGMFFAATLNRTLKSFALGIVGAEYVLRWVPEGTHRWEQFVTPAELEEAMEKAGLDPLARTGMAFDPLRGVWRKSRDMAINYMMAASRRR